MLAGSIYFEGKPAIIGTILDVSDRKRAEDQREKLIKNLQEALDNIKTLKGLLPICANCKKIRDDNRFQYAFGGMRRA